MELRARNNVIDPSLDRPLDDTYLRPSWYSVSHEKGSFRMPDFSTMPTEYSCGSLDQIHLNETHPRDDDLNPEPMYSVACNRNCINSWVVQIRKCHNNDIQYKFPYVKNGPISFCLDPPELQGKIDFDKAPVVEGINPEVNVQLQFHERLDLMPHETVYMPYLNFTCDVNIVLDEGLLVTTDWYIGQTLVISLGPSTSLEPLLEDMLISRKIKFGFMLHCSLRFSTSPTGLLSKPSISKAKFYGIKVHTPSVVINKGDSVNVTLEPTLPIGCMHIASVTSCVHSLRMENPEIECNLDNIISVQETRRCATNFQALVKQDKWIPGKTYQFEITTKDTNYADAHLYRVPLKMEGGKHAIWNDYRLNDILVYIKHMNLYKYSLCYSHVDPHMQTPDGYRYENQYAGEFILYRNTEYGIEVQEKTTSCNRGRAFCACAVAVRAGGDVFLINLCGKLNYIGLTSCGDSGILDVQKKSSYKYEVRTPIGTRVVIQIRPHINYHKLMNIDIYMAPKDLNKTEGLCGYFDGHKSNDMRMRNKKVLAIGNSRRNFHPQFSESWRIQSNEKNYLKVNIGSVITWELEGRKMFCVCDSAVVGRPDDSSHNVNCSASLFENCESEMSETQEMCYRLSKRRRRSVLSNSRELNRLDELANVDDAIYDMVNDAEVFETTELSDGRDICRRAIDGNFVVKEFAHRLLGIDKNQAIEECGFDVDASNDTGWVESYLEALKQVIEINNDKDPKYTMENEDEVSRFKEQMCLRNCSDKGYCNPHGSCDCYTGFNGPDCSINIHDPIGVTDIEGGGLCDIDSGDDCTCFEIQTINLLAPFYCRSIKTTMFTNGTYGEMDPLIHEGDTYDIFRGECCVSTSVQSNDTLATLLDISVSNDGVNFGKAASVTVFRSECQLVMKDAGVVLKNQTCFIDGMCLFENDTDTYDECKLCQPEVNKFDWTHNCEVITQKTSEDNRNFIVIISASTSVCVLLMILLVVCIALRTAVKKRKTVHDVQIFASVHLKNTENMNRRFQGNPRRY